jgi:hypothetical protein
MSFLTTPVSFYCEAAKKSRRVAPAVAIAQTLLPENAAQTPAVLRLFYACFTVFLLEKA